MSRHFAFCGCGRWCILLLPDLTASSSSDVRKSHARAFPMFVSGKDPRFHKARFRDWKSGLHPYVSVQPETALTLFS